MTEYIKLWLAKDIAEIGTFLAFILVIAVALVFFGIYLEVRRWWHNWRRNTHD